MKPRVRLQLRTSRSEAELLAQPHLRVRLPNEANKPTVKALLRLLEIPEELRLHAECADEPGAAPQALLVEIDPRGGMEHGNGKILADVLPLLYSSSADVFLILHHLARCGDVLTADLLGYEP